MQVFDIIKWLEDIKLQEHEFERGLLIKSLHIMYFNNIKK